MKYQCVTSFHRHWRHSVLAEDLLRNPVEPGPINFRALRTMNSEPLSMASRQNRQATFLDCGIRQWEPDRDHLGIIDFWIEKGAILVPRSSSAQERAGFRISWQQVFRDLETHAHNGIRVDLAANQGLEYVHDAVISDRIEYGRPRPERSIPFSYCGEADMG